MSNSSNNYNYNYNINSDLAKIATTASVLVNSASGLNNTHNILRNNSTYQKAMNETINDRTNNQSSLIKKHGDVLKKSINLKRKVDNSSFKKLKKKDFNVLTEDLLNEIPNSSNENENFKNSTNGNNGTTEGINRDKINSDDFSVNANGNENISTAFSLFQGFTAVLPEIDETITKLTENSDKLLEFNSVDFVNNPSSLIGSITNEKIKSSQNKKQLFKFKKDINYRLDLIEIRKGLASNEIKEIDNKIDRLYVLRKNVFNRIATFENDESYLEKQLDEIENRLEIVKDVDLGNGNDNDKDNDNDSDNEHNLNNLNIEKKYNEANDKEGDNEEDEEEQDEEYDEDYIKIDNSDGKLSGNEEISTSILSKSIHKALKPLGKRVNSRKHKPTLQKYYKPGNLINEFQAHDDSITCLCFDAPYGSLVTSSMDNTVKVWDLSRSRCKGLLEGHYSTVKCLEMQDNIVITGSMDATMKMWDLNKLNALSDNSYNSSNPKDGELESPLVHTFESHVEEITALSFTNQTLVSGSSDKTIRQWDINTGHLMQTIDVVWASSMMMNSINNVSTVLPPTQMNHNISYPFIGALQCYDAALASGTSDGIVRLWDLRSGEVIRQLIGHTGPVTCLQFDDINLTTGSADRSIRIWDLRTGGITDSFAYESPITSLQFDQSKIVCSNNETSVKLYDRIDEKHLTVGGGDDRKVVNWCRYKEGYLVEGRDDGMVGVWAI